MPNLAVGDELDLLIDDLVEFHISQLKNTKRKNVANPKTSFNWQVKAFFRRVPGFERGEVEKVEANGTLEYSANYRGTRQKEEYQVRLLTPSRKSSRADYSALRKLSLSFNLESQNQAKTVSGLPAVFLREHGDGEILLIAVGARAYVAIKAINSAKRLQLLEFARLFSYQAAKKLSESH